MSVNDSSAEELLVAWLQARLTALGDTAHVTTSRATDSPQRLVRLMRAGGTLRNYVEDWPIVIFEAWDQDDSAAEQLARLVREEVTSLDNEPVGGAYLTWMDEIGGLTFFPHPDTEMPRYQTTQQLKLVG